MTVLDVSQLPGVSNSQLAALNRVGVFTSADLLRSNRSALSQAIGFPVEEILGWQALSTFLEVEGLSLEAIEALFAARIDRLDEFCAKSLSELRPSLQGLAVPLSDDAIVATLMVARRLQFTGVLNGTVVTRNGGSLAGAVATVGGRTATTDARGRFRIAGLRLDAVYAVSINHPEKAARIFNRVTAHPGSALIGRRFVLSGRPTPPARLSAQNGDELPPFGTAPVATEMRTEPLVPEDRYVLFGFFSNGDGRLGSLFLDFDMGRFVQRCYRVPKAELPTGCKLRDRMLLESGQLKVVKITAGKIGRLTRTRGVHRRFSGLTMTPALREQKLRLLLKAMSDPN